jgi:hypothetical protein
MRLILHLIAPIVAAALCITACSPASDYKDNEQRWLGNQLTQPVEYRRTEHGSTGKIPMTASMEGIPTTADQTTQTSTHPSR